MHSLLIANASSLWAKEFIIHILQPEWGKIFLTAFSPLDPEDEAYYRQKGVIIIPLYSGKKEFFLLEKIKKATKIRRQIHEIVRREGPFYGCFIQGMPTSIQAYILPSILKKSAKIRVGIFIGSDLLRVPFSKAKRLKGCLKQLDYINLGTEQLREKFFSFFGHGYDDKITRCFYGSPGLEAIKDLQSAHDQEKQKEDALGGPFRENPWNIPASKKNIFVGYNSSRNQQHIPVIEALNGCTKEEKESIHLVLHWGYGDGSPAYREEVKKALTKSEIGYTIIDEMLDLKTMAKLRLLIDVFIHAQTSDALSSSVRESLFAGSLLLNPSWIHYREFEEEAIDYVSYDDISQLPLLISKILRGEVTVDTRHNRQKIEEKFSWEAVKKGWMELYDH